MTVFDIKPNAKRGQGRDIGRQVPGTIKLQVDQHGTKVKHSGKHVLEFGDPSYRFYLDWMQRKDGSRKPGSRNFKPAQNSDEEQGRDAM
jgi:hypothetical protein